MLGDPYLNQTGDRLSINPSSSPLRTSCLHRRFRFAHPLRFLSLDLFLLHTLPLKRHCTQDPKTTRHQRNHENRPQRFIVIYEGLRPLIRRKLIDQGRNAARRDHIWTEARRAGQTVQQLCCDHVLSDSEEDGRAEQADEQIQREAHGDILFRQRGHHCEIWHLERPAEAEAVDDLVADPFRFGCVDLQCREQTGADGHEAGSCDGPLRVVADLRGREPTGELSNHRRDYNGQSPDAGFDGGHLCNSLEPDWEVVDWNSWLVSS